MLNVKSISTLCFVDFTFTFFQVPSIQMLCVCTSCNFGFCMVVKSPFRKAIEHENPSQLNMQRSNFLWRTLASKIKTNCINSMKNPTVLESSSDVLLNWSHRQMMGSKLLSSVCKYPQRHKSTCHHESTIPCQLQCRQWDHNLAISEPFNNCTKWCPVGLTALMLSFLHAFRKPMFSMLLEKSYDEWEKCGRQWQQAAIQLVPLSPRYFSSSPRDPSVVRSLFIDNCLLLPVCFCASI